MAPGAVHGLCPEHSPCLCVAGCAIYASTRRLPRGVQGAALPVSLLPLPTSLIPRPCGDSLDGAVNLKGEPIPLDSV